DWPCVAAGVGDGLWMGSGQYGTGPLVAAVVGGPAAAICEDSHYRFVDWFWRLWRYLWTWHGHRRYGGGHSVASVLPCSARCARYSWTVCDCGHDGALWWDCPRATGRYADGCGNDRQSLDASSCDGCSRYLLYSCGSGDDLHQPGRDACRFARSPFATLLSLAFYTDRPSGYAASLPEILTTANHCGGRVQSGGTYREWSARR